MKKLKAAGGETLVEVLIAILVVALSATMLLSMIGSASKLNKRARLINAASQSEMEAAVSGEDGADGEITVNGSSVQVSYSGGEGKLTSFTLKGADGE